MINFRPLFMLSAPRSGTTILFHILNLHPNIILSNEFWISELVSNINHWKHTRPWLPNDCIFTMISSLYRQNKPNATYFGDKAPGSYIFYNVLKNNLPWMLLIENLRNPYEQIASGLSRKNWMSFEQHLHLIDQTWNMHRHAESQGTHVSKIKIEKLIEDPDSTLKQLCQEMDLPTGEEFLKQAKNLITKPNSKIHLLSLSQIKNINITLGKRINEMGYDVI